jgi:hypothetical protein
VLQLTKSGGRWVKKITLPIAGKQSYQYKFVINGSDWCTNDAMPIADDGRGNRNNVIVVPND